MDLVTVCFVISGAICCFMIGYNYAKKSEVQTINNTITYLCDEGFINYYTTADNEIEIVKLNGDLDNGEEKEDTSS